MEIKSVEESLSTAGEELKDMKKQLSSLEEQVEQARKQRDEVQARSVFYSLSPCFLFRHPIFGFVALFSIISNLVSFEVTCLLSIILYQLFNVALFHICRLDEADAERRKYEELISDLHKKALYERHQITVLQQQIASQDALRKSQEEELQKARYVTNRV